MRKLGMLAFGLVAIALCLGANAADDKKKMTIKQVMKAANGKAGLCAKCAEAGKAGKWEDATKLSKEFLTVAEALAENKPPKGDDDSWKEHTKTYKTNVEAIGKAAADKDAKAVADAAEKFTKSCGACHSKHK